MSEFSKDGGWVATDREGTTVLTQFFSSKGLTKEMVNPPF